MLGKIGLLKYNGKIFLRKEYLAGLIYLLLLPVIFNFRLLTLDEAAMIGETYFSLFGVIFLTSIIELDFLDGVVELVANKKIQLEKIFFLRLLMMIIVLSIITVSLYGYMLFQGSVFPISELFLGTLITEVFLGLIGVTAANLSRNLILGYLLGISYFFFEYLSQGLYTRKLYLFGLIRGDVESKYYLVLAIFLLVWVNWLILKRRKTN